MLSSAESQNGKTAWLCRCDCGNETVIPTRYLRSGKKDNCGCQRKKRGVEQMHYVEGTCIELIRSTAVRSNNRSGHRGVFFDRATGKWRAEIMLSGKRKCLGRYPKYSEAVKARERAEDDLYLRFLSEHPISQAK